MEFQSTIPRYLGRRRTCSTSLKFHRRVEGKGERSRGSFTPVSFELLSRVLPIQVPVLMLSRIADHRDWFIGKRFTGLSKGCLEATFVELDRCIDAFMMHRQSRGSFITDNRLSHAAPVAHNHPLHRRLIGNEAIAAADSVFAIVSILKAPLSTRAERRTERRTRAIFNYRRGGIA